MLNKENKDRFVELFCNFTNASKKEIKLFLKDESDVVNLLKRPQTFITDSKTLEKITQLNELRLLMKDGLDYNKKKISSPEDVFNHLIRYSEKTDKEYFLVLFLDTKNNIIKTDELNIGKHNSSLVAVKDLCKRALMYDSASVIISHNHPSGSSFPSNEDIDMTDRIDEALKILDIKLLDHIILGEESFTSIKELRNQNGHIFGIENVNEDLKSIENYSSSIKEFVEKKEYDFRAMKKMISENIPLQYSLTNDEDIINMDTYEDMYKALHESIDSESDIKLYNNTYFEYKIKDSVIDYYREEFPLIKMIDIELAGEINEMNKSNNKNLTIEELYTNSEIANKLEFIKCNFENSNENESYLEPENVIYYESYFLEQ